ncbi:MAG: hypothetical protein INH41_23015 [Myxococcaceae bacterium]|jgi:hypothetical protein|nr:hypothetical protein [Myxococcaceae bacterium]MCA3015271.1 hypothetical protein [Myxococcaceae bacterium]
MRDELKRRWRAYLEGQAEFVQLELIDHPESLAHRWWAGVLQQVEPHLVLPEFKDGVTGLQARLGEGPLDEALRQAGVPRYLTNIWDTTFALHHSGVIHGVLAGWAVRLIREPAALVTLIYAACKYGPGLSISGRDASQAVDRLCQHALSLDPTNEDVRWAYEQPNFLPGLGRRPGRPPPA